MNLFQWIELLAMASYFLAAFLTLIVVLLYSTGVVTRDTQHIYYSMCFVPLITSAGLFIYLSTLSPS